MATTRAKIKKTEMQASVPDSDHHSTQSAAVIISNEDLLTEILLRLPVISILRFKSVSKQWRSIVSHSRFNLRYYPLPRSLGCFVTNVYVPFDAENGGILPFGSLNFNIDPSGITILQSCNGLLLCKSSVINTANCTYYVLNPTTKEYAILPSVPGVDDISKPIVFMGLAFHQTECPHYKVVCIRCLKHKEVYQIQVYSSVTGKWEISVESFNTDRLFGRGVYWNGAMHWSPSWRGNCFYFKIKEKQLQTLPLPLEMTAEDEVLIKYFGESRGHLHLIGTSFSEFPEDCLRLNVYEMLSDHSGWFVKYKVQLDGLLTAFPEMDTSFGYSFSVSDVIRGEKEEDTMMVLTLPYAGKMVTFNVHDKSFKKIFDIKGYTLPVVRRYTETLASLKIYS